MKLSDADALVMNRLFGGRLDLDDDGVRAFADEATEVAKSVDFQGPVTDAAMDCLLGSIIYGGLGGFSAGWSLATKDGRATLAVHKIKPADQIAA